MIPDRVRGCAGRAGAASVAHRYGR